MKKLILSGLIISITNPSVTFADEQKQNDQNIEIVVTASRGAEEDKLSVPQTIESVSRDSLDINEYSDIDDSVRRLPNVALAPAEGNPNFWQEGFTIRGLGAQRVLTLSDGVRQAGQGIGYGGGNLSLYDPFQIERIEVLRGPSSVMYGTDAFGGVVNIINRKPTERTDAGANAAVRYTYDGSYNRNRAGAYLDFGNDKIQTILGGGFTDSGEPNLPDDEDPRSGSYESTNFWGTTNVKLSEKATLSFTGSANLNDDILVLDSVIVLPIAKFGPPGSAENIFSPMYFNIEEYNRTLAGVKLSVEDLTDTLKTFESGFHWQGLTRKFHRETAFYPNFGPGFSGPPLFVDPTATVATSVVDTDDEANTYEWQNQAEFALGSHTLRAGLDVGFDTSELPETESQQVVARAGIGHSREHLTTTERVRADAEQVRIGLFAQDTFSLENLAALQLQPGVRVDSISVDDTISDYSEDEIGVSGSLGALYKLNSEHSLYSTLATGYRVPDLGERFQDAIVNLGVPTRVIGKEDLDPERSYSLELGGKGRSENTEYGIAGFYNYVNDFIGRKPIGLVQGYVTEQYDNEGLVRLYGVEGSVDHKLNDYFKFYAAAGRTWTSEEEIVNVPDWTFNYGPEVNLPVNRLGLEAMRVALNLRTVLESEDNIPNPGRDKFDADGFTVADLMFNFDLAEMHQVKGSILAGVKNLFDETYQEPFFPQNQPGRAFYVGTQFNF
ncbi:TonB-dependent receptor [bacterium]|nr:TonB-dependent receptor [bacterium]